MSDIERVTFDGMTLDLTDLTEIESPGYGTMLSGREPGTTRSHRIALALIETRVPLMRVDDTPSPQA